MKKTNEKFSSGNFQLYIIALFTLSTILVDQANYLVLIVLLPVAFYLVKSHYLNSIYLSIFMLSSIEQVPSNISVSLIIFIFSFFLVFAFFPYQCIPKKKFKVELWITLIFIIIVLLNFFVAINNSTNVVTPTNWFRGAIPFLFISICFPVYYSVRNREDIHKIIISILFTSILFAIQSLYISINTRIWELKKWVKINGSWEEVDSLSLIHSSDVMYAVDRITMIFAKSTNEIFLIGFFISIIVLIASKNCLLRWISGFGWIIILFNLIISYSKSFHIIVLLGFVFLGWSALFYKKYKVALKYVSVFLVTILVTASIVNALDLVAFKNRYRIFYSYVTTTTTTNTNTNTDTNTDTNVIARLDEIKIAYKLFQEKPILGQGLGVTHEIMYDTGKDTIKKFVKGYIHNSIFYFMMTMGIVGLVLYLGIYIMTAKRAVQFLENEYVVSSIMLNSLLCLLIYSLVFAVFRLIDFNLLLGVFIGMASAMAEFSEKES